jgi:hypothetical protein
MIQNICSSVKAKVCAPVCALVLVLQCLGEKEPLAAERWLLRAVDPARRLKRLAVRNLQGGERGCPGIERVVRKSAWDRSGRVGGDGLVVAGGTGGGLRH